MTPTNIQWRRIAGITAVQSAITLAWVIYSLYLPDLLVQLGFAKTLAGTLLMIEHALEAVIEPIFGNLSDRSQRSLGTRFPWISLGVVLTSALLIILPIIVLWVPSGSAWRWIFSNERAGLGVGAYFGAFGGAISFFDGVFASFKGLELPVNLGAIAFMVASLFIIIGQQYRFKGDR